MSPFTVLSIFKNSKTVTGTAADSDKAAGLGVCECECDSGEKDDLLDCGTGALCGSATLIMAKVASGEMRGGGAPKVEA